jgi:aminoacrylate peracid reductase
VTSHTTWSAVNPPGMAAALAPYSMASVTADGWIHTGGLVAIDASGCTIAPGDVRSQTLAIFAQARCILGEAGASLADVIFVHIFIKDYADYATMNAAYRELLGVDGRPFPPRYCVCAELVRPELLVEFAFEARRR